jgi:hypothetical protein
VVSDPKVITAFSNATLTPLLVVEEGWGEELVICPAVPAGTLLVVEEG